MLIIHLNKFILRKGKVLFLSHPVKWKSMDTPPHKWGYLKFEKALGDSYTLFNITKVNINITGSLMQHKFNQIIEDVNLLIFYQIQSVTPRCLLETLSSNFLALPWRRFVSYRNHSIDLLFKSMRVFLYDRELRHERVKDVI